jgi:transposase
MRNHTKKNHSIQNSNLPNSINSMIVAKESLTSSNHAITPDMAKMLKNAGISSIVMTTGELLDIFPDQDTPAKKIGKHKKPSIRHKNSLGYINPTVAGIDIGDKVIHVAIPDGSGGSYVKEFGTTTPDLMNIAKELKNAGVITAVMEATGIYWVPLFEILEDLNFKPILVDARAVKNVPGRKSDVIDCQWIQTLYSSGLLRAAFRPPKDRLKLRSYVRVRMNIVKTRQVALLHIEKTLQLMNIKLSTAVSDIAGVSGMAIIRAIAAGKKDPVMLAKLRNQACKKDESLFIAALTGNFQVEHIFGLQMALNQYDFSSDQLKECDKKIYAELETFPNVVETLPPSRKKDKTSKKGKYNAAKKPEKNGLNFDARTILWRKTGLDFTVLSGVGTFSALLIYAELGGTDMSHWKNVKHFSSWLKVSPGNNISGGKMRKSKRQPCANYITQTLRMCAMAAKKGDSSLGAHIRQISGRTDKAKGIKAGAHKLAHLIYYMCRDGWEYHEKGAEAYEKAHAKRCVKSLEKKAKLLGYKLVAQ